MELNDFLSLTYVASYVGSVVVIMLVTQFVKELPGIAKIPTRYLVSIIALVHMIIVARPALIVEDIYLMLINALLLTLTATGGYDFAVKKTTITFDEAVQQNGQTIDLTGFTAPPTQDPENG